MNLSENRRPLVIGACLAALAIAGLLAIVVASEASDETPPPASDPSGVTDFFASVKPATEGQVMELPEQVQQVLASVGRGKAVEALGRTTSAAGDEIVLADVTGTFCAFKANDVRGGGTCGSREEAIGGELISIAFCQPGLPQGSAAVFGVMQDGIESVTFERADGESQVVEVRGNTYETQVSAGQDTTIRAINEQGRRIALPIPLADLSEANGNCG